MRFKVTVLLLVLTVAGAAAVVATAQSTANGLPAFTNGYAKWRKINRKPITTPGAHNGVKNVFASRRKVGTKYPNGTVIVKSIREPGSSGLPSQVAVMRKVSGKWRWVEWQLSGSRYTVLAQGQLCVTCHMQAKSNDWVFTK